MSLSKFKELKVVPFYRDIVDLDFGRTFKLSAEEEKEGWEIIQILYQEIINYDNLFEEITNQTRYQQQYGFQSKYAVHESNFTRSQVYLVLGRTELGDNLYAKSI